MTETNLISKENTEEKEFVMTSKEEALVSDVEKFLELVINDKDKYNTFNKDLLSFGSYLTNKMRAKPHPEYKDFNVQDYKMWQVLDTVSKKKIKPKGFDVEGEFEKFIREQMKKYERKNRK